MKIVIFGGSGFTGIHLVQQLMDLGYKILVCDINTPNIQNVDFIECDIVTKRGFDLIAFDPSDIVINLAANQYHHKVPRKNRKAFFFDTNVLGASNILEFVFAHGGKKYIQFSTDMIYGKPLYLPIDARHPQNPFGPYGKSKQATEELCREYREKGMDITIFRPRMIIGPGRLGILKKLFFLIKHNLPVPVIGSGKNCYQMISVFDCVSACVKAIEAHCPNREYNLGSKNSPSVRRLMGKLIKDAGRKGWVIPTPAFLVKLTLAFFGFCGFEIMYKEQYMIADKNCILDTTETENDLQWTPLYNDENMVAEAYRDYIRRNEK